MIKAGVDEKLEAQAIVEPIQTLEESGLDRAEVEALAYGFWLERGSPHGSSEEDWYRAEAELARRRANASADPAELVMTAASGS